MKHHKEEKHNKELEGFGFFFLYERIEKLFNMTDHRSAGELGEFVKIHPPTTLENVKRFLREDFDPCSHNVVHLVGTADDSFYFNLFYQYSKLLLFFFLYL